MANSVWLLCFVAVAGLVYRLRNVGQRPSRCPPGPPTIPIIGNLHQLAMAYPDTHLLYQKWAQEYGPIFSIILGTKVMMIVSDDETVKELIDRRGAIASARPDMYIGAELASGGFRAGFESDKSKWRPLRKISHTGLSVKRVTEYSLYIDIESKQLMFEMLQGAPNLVENLGRFASSLITSVVFGSRWQTVDNPRMKELFRIIEETTMIGSSSLAPFIDFFPILRNIPSMLYPLKRKAMNKHQEEKPFFRGFYMPAKNAILQKLPAARLCMIKDIVAVQEQENLSDDFAAYLACAFLEAGSETSSSQLYGFVQAMLLFPEAQRECQAELDALCGDNRWPEFDDLPNLPSIRACIKETLRWMPAGIIGAIPHSLTEDTEYMGYHLPAGAGITVNTWSIHRDPARYPSPEKFILKRFLGDNTTSAQSAILPDASARDHFGFGAGRRICPGMNLVERTLPITMARMLWAFDFKPKIGPDGKPKLPLQDQFVGGATVRPKDFEMEIVPRSEKRATFVRDIWEDAKKNLDAEGQFLTNPI